MLEVEGLERLIELQRVDDELSALEAEHGAVPARRSEIEEGEARSAQRLSDAREALEAAEADQRRAEAELQDQESLLQRLEGQQNQVKTNEAYTALLHEMDAARGAISDHETQILESMERIEAARADLSEAERLAAQDQVRLSAQRETLAARETELDREISRLRGLRQETCARLTGVAGGILDRYEKIAARKRPAVVLVSAEVCAGCRVNIPSLSYMDLLQRKRLVTCENCHRILLHEHSLRDAPAP